MPLTYAQPVNYPSPLVPIPSLTQTEPEEGRMTVPVEILWDTMGGTAKSVLVSLMDDGVHPMRQIASVIVDNSACATALQLIFPDTGEVLPVPAGAKRLAVGVYTNATEFVVLASAVPAALAATRIQVLNYRIPPVVIL